MILIGLFVAMIVFFITAIILGRRGNIGISLFFLILGNIVSAIINMGCLH